MIFPSNTCVSVTFVALRDERDLNESTNIKFEFSSVKINLNIEENHQKKCLIKLWHEPNDVQTKKKKKTNKTLM